MKTRFLMCACLLMVALVVSPAVAGSYTDTFDGTVLNPFWQTIPVSNNGCEGRLEDGKLLLEGTSQSTDPDAGAWVFLGSGSLPGSHVTASVDLSMANGTGWRGASLEIGYNSTPGHWETVYFAPGTNDSGVCDDAGLWAVRAMWYRNELGHNVGEVYDEQYVGSYDETARYTIDKDGDIVRFYVDALDGYGPSKVHETTWSTGSADVAVLLGANAGIIPGSVHTEWDNFQAAWEPVPEPSSLLALLSGAAGLCGLALRRRK